MMCRPKIHVFSLLVALVVCACAKPVAEFAPGEPCDAGNFVVTDDFDGARRGECQVFAEQRIRIHIEPEDAGPINDSPWYAFRLVPSDQVEATITLRYHGGKHRYWPKVSFDRIHWTRLDESAVDISFFRSSATFTVALDAGPVWVAAQEIILPTDVEKWIDEQSSHPQVTKTQLGVSASEIPIYKLDINPESKEVVFLAGRQHPPEVSGSFGFQGFYKAIVAESELAARFRDRFHIVALPMLNPDGVIAGHWRHNTGGVDLNRDWGLFTQAETQLVDELLNSYDELGKRVRISVDFHSTASNLMYTQTDDDTTNPTGFTNQWIAAALPRLEDYEFTEEPRAFSELATGRNYMYERYGVPSVTFEVGDEEDRAATIKAAGVFAEEMMRLLNDDGPGREPHN